MATSYFCLGRGLEGRTERLLKQVQEKPEIYELKAQAFLAMGQLFMAIRFATLATEQLPDWAPAYLTLARAQFEFGELELSRQSYERCFQLNPAVKYASPYSQGGGWR